MNKVIKSSVGIIMTLVLLCTVFVSPTFAAAITESDWNAYWQSYIDDGASLYMAPGSNPTEMNFSWQGTAVDASPSVAVKKAGDADYTVFTGTCVTSSDVTAAYRVTVKDLEPETVYEYIYSANGLTSAPATFKTAAADSFSAIFVSDIHVSYSEEDSESLKRTAYNFHNILDEASNKEDFDLILSAGDQADHGLLSEYSGLFASPIVKGVPFATTCGNHDFKDNVYPYVTNRPNDYNKDAVSPDKNGGDYWFVKGDVLFLMLNSNWISAEDHHIFVEKAVNANPDVKWRVAVMHHDLFGGHIESREEENTWLRNMFVPIFDEFMVDMVLMGHSHVFSRSQVVYDKKQVTDISNVNEVTDAEGTIYITTGSTSRPRGDVASRGDLVAVDHVSGEDNIYNLVDFNEDSITVKSYVSGSDSAFETFTVNKTTNNGGHPDNSVNPIYDLLFNITTIGNIFRNIAFIFEELLLRLGIEI